MNFVDESGKAINHLSVERNEQLQAGRYIRPESVVLELGARYGTVSCVINSKLAVKTNQVSVEPDSRIHAALELNMRANDCEFHIVKGVISKTPIVLAALDSYNGYGTTSVKAETSSITSYRLEDIEAMYGLTFDTLVADCEGFLEQFFDENPDFYKQLKLVMFEQDYPHKCNYAKITGVLRQQGFVQLEAGFHQVWRRPTAGPQFKNVRVIHMSSATERSGLVSDIIALTNARVFEAIVTPRNGHIGCTRSHRAIYREVPVGEDLLIFEDDCEIIDPSFMEYVETHKKDYDIIYIGILSRFTTLNENWIPSGSYGTHAMWIGPTALKAFINTKTDIIQIDHIWSMIENRDKLRVLRAVPNDRYVRQKQGIPSYIRRKA